MPLIDDRLDDFNALGIKLRLAVAALDDPEAKSSGSDAAGLARERRGLNETLDVDHVAEYRSDYDLLGDALGESSGSGAASIARERRLIAERLERLERPEGEVPVVDQLAAKRAESGASRPPARRRKS